MILRTIFVEIYDIPVVINDDKILPFDEFCRAISGNKIKISAIRLNKNSQNCIQKYQCPLQN